MALYLYYLAVKRAEASVTVLRDHYVALAGSLQEDIATSRHTRGLRGIQLLDLNTLHNNSTIMTDSKTPDLARIRDNQRRSRARRKEYLQELESKFRLCERTGAEASSEIQSAARAVAEENKRLRLLLQQHGISDPELRHSHQSPSAASLEHALSVRKSCGPADRGASAPPVQSHASQPQPQSEQQWESYPPPHMSATSSSPFPLEEQYTPMQQQPQLNSCSTSCYDIASVIRTVRPYMGTELEAQLGCADGRDCSIPNAQAFDILDQISESQHTP